MAKKIVKNKQHAIAMCFNVRLYVPSVFVSSIGAQDTFDHEGIHSKIQIHTVLQGKSPILSHFSFSSFFFFFFLILVSSSYQNARNALSVIDGS